MRTIRTKLYQFDELSKEAQQTAISKNYDINVDFDWWSFIYDDAKNIGLSISTFDIDRGDYCKGEFVDDAMECARLIIAEHGETCETYKTAKNYISDYGKLVYKYSDGIKSNYVAEGNEHAFDQEADELDAEFLKSILEDYRIILSKEYAFLTSDEAIAETIRSNEYEFTIDGKQF